MNTNERHLIDRGYTAGPEEHFTLCSLGDERHMGRAKREECDLHPVTHMNYCPECLSEYRNQHGERLVEDLIGFTDVA